MLGDNCPLDRSFTKVLYSFPQPSLYTHSIDHSALYKLMGNEEGRTHSGQATDKLQFFSVFQEAYSLCPNPSLLQNDFWYTQLKTVIRL